MARMMKRMIWAAAALMAVASTAEAHTGVGGTAGFAHGFMHPLSGVDHILAMVAVGLFAARLGGKALWAVPAAFVSMMAFGGALGISGVGLPFVETGIAASVIVLGAIVALQVRLPVAMAIGLVGFFALFHGHAHGAEMPISASGMSYALGFMSATALLHAAGIGLGLTLGRFASHRVTRVVQAAGALMAVAGVGLLNGYL